MGFLPLTSFENLTRGAIIRRISTGRTFVVVALSDERTIAVATATVTPDNLDEFEIADPNLGFDFDVFDRNLFS